MFNFADSINQLRSIDNIVSKDNGIQKINPLAKLIITIVYILTVVSISKYNVSSLYPFIFYQIILLYLSDIPIKLVLNMTLVGLPLVIGLGLFNLILDRRVFISLGIITISYGMLSFTSLFIKGCLTITAGVIFICTVGMEDLARALRKIHVPRIITSQLVFMYRYIFVLIELVHQVNNAYMLRAPKQKGINFKVWGPLLGNLLIRSFDRADRIYNAMILRGFDGEYVTYTNQKLEIRDFFYIIIWIAFFLLIKYINIPLLIGNIVIGRGI